MVFKKTVSSHTDVVGEATEILQSVPVVVVLDDILYSSVAVLIAATLRLWLMASSSARGAEGIWDFRPKGDGRSGP